MRDAVHLIDLGTGSSRNLLPLGVALIASNAQLRLGSDCDFFVEFLRHDTDRIADTSRRPLAFGLALYMWNLRASMRLATDLKQRFPSVPVVCGGYSVPKDPRRKAKFFAEYPCADILVHGEGEMAFTDLVETLLGGGDLSTVQGITYRCPDAPEGFVTTAQRPRIADLDTIPSPFLNGVFDDVLARYGEHVTGAIWETNRGCPFSCTFCDWGNADVFKVKKYDIDRLTAEVEWMAGQGINYINVADANFGIFHERDLEIASRISAIRAQTGYPRFMAMNWTKNSHERVVSIAERFATGGVPTSVTLSVQSFNPATLEAIKRQNIKNSEMEKLKASFHDRDLPTNTDIILGLPEETYDSFMAGLGQVMSPRLADHWMFNMCFLLENAELSSEEQRRKHAIETRYCSSMVARSVAVQDEDEEYEEVVVGTRTMPTADWSRSYMNGFMCTVLHNFRVAFFPIVYLQREFAVDALDYVAFLIEEVSANRHRYPRLRLAIELLERQRAKILASDSCFSSIPELGGTAQFPSEGILAILLDDADALYRDVAGVTKVFSQTRGIAVAEDVLDEIIAYQRLRMPVWPAPERLERAFAYSVADYFEAVTGGGEAAVIERRANRVSVQIPKHPFTDKFAFAAQRTRYGHTIDLYEVDSSEDDVGEWGPSTAPAAAAM